MDSHSARPGARNEHRSERAAVADLAAVKDLVHIFVVSKQEVTTERRRNEEQGVMSNE
jgi:hypothetical protein